MVSSKRTKYALSAVMDIIGGGTPKTSIPEYWNGDIPWLSVTDFGGGTKFVFDTEKKITQLGVENSSTKILKKGQLIISARGTVGEIAMLANDMAFNQSCYGLNANDLTTNDFLYYLLKYSIADIRRITHGAVFDTITRETFDRIIVELPSLPEQRAIAGVLGALDDKIELNRRMNRTLESIAWAVFRAWFVESEENDYQEISLDDIANFLNGLALQKYPAEEGKDFLPVIKIAQLRKKETSDADKASTNIPVDYIIHDGDVLFSWSGSLEVVIWCGGHGALNQHLFKVTSRDYPKWLYYFWIMHHLSDFQAIAAGKATTMGHIQRHHLHDAKVLVPSNNELTKMDKVMSPILDMIIINEKESRALASLRDSLLPKLMRGEVRVKYG